MRWVGGSRADGVCLMLLDPNAITIPQSYNAHIGVSKLLVCLRVVDLSRPSTLLLLLLLYVALDRCRSAVSVCGFFGEEDSLKWNGWKNRNAQQDDQQMDKQSSNGCMNMDRCMYAYR